MFIPPPTVASATMGGGCVPLAAVGGGGRGRGGRRRGGGGGRVAAASFVDDERRDNILIPTLATSSSECSISTEYNDDVCERTSTMPPRDGNVAGKSARPELARAGNFGGGPATDDDASHCSVLTEERRDDDDDDCDGMWTRGMSEVDVVGGTTSRRRADVVSQTSNATSRDAPSSATCIREGAEREARGERWRRARRHGVVRKGMTTTTSTTTTHVSVVARDEDAAEGVVVDNNDDDDRYRDEWYTGRIVGLILPKCVDPGYETRKPSDRRVDPNEYPLSRRGAPAVRCRMPGDDAEGNDNERDDRDDRWMPWRGGENAARDGRRDDGMTNNVALDVRVCVHRRRRRGEGGGAQRSHPSITNEKICHVRLTRDPNEAVQRTLQRLRLSVLKKVQGSIATMKTRIKVEGGILSTKGGYGKKDDDEDVLLWKRKERERRIIIEGGEDDGTDTTTPPSRENDDEGAMACIAQWDALLSKFALPINPCNPWNGTTPLEDRHIPSADGKDIAPRVGHGGDVAAEDGGVSVDGYELVTVDGSLTIGEVLRLAMTESDGSGGYAVSVPVAWSSSRIPITIESCPPTITSVSTFGSFVDTHLFVNTPIVVDVGLLYSTGALITWFVDRERVRADGPCYTPKVSDIGRVLTVVIVPQRPGHDGEERGEAYQFKRRIEALPPLPIVRPLREEFMNRSSNGIPHEQWRNTGTTDKNDATMTLRVVTYNILADQNLSRDIDKPDDTDRVYSHCTKEHLVKWRRHPLILHEILEYRPDVIALQEVDTDIYADLFRLVLKVKGYEGFFSQKGVDAKSGVREGCAMFWSLDAFESVRPVDMQTHSFREMIQEFTCEEAIQRSQWKSLKHMSELLDKHDSLKRIMLDKLGHIFQTVVLTQRHSGEKLVVGNTHLFYHPMASHVRCLKTLIACRQLEILHRENQLCPIIFCGDLNSHPESGVMKLLLNRYLNASNGMTWKHLCLYEWEEGEGSGVHHDVDAIDLEFPPSFPKLLSGYPIPPDFTHYIEAFSGTLDYILVTNNFEVVKTGATPTRDLIKKYIAMPNECMPSDHVSLVCDLKWR
jgi:mRNA deadenylase 3'-5' endonuclease subunit Ccr4